MPEDERLLSRRPVWIALSDLYLDTDVRLSYCYILRTLLASHYSIEELRAILENELAPVLEPNLLCVAGEWAAFDEEWLVEEASKRLDTRRWLPRLAAVDSDWEVLSALLAKLRSLDPDNARRQLLAWELAMPLILHKDPTPRPPTGTDPPLPELEHALRQDLLPLMAPEAERLARKSPGSYPSLADIEANWTRFAASRAE